MTALNTRGNGSFLLDRLVFKPYREQLRFPNQLQFRFIAREADTPVIPQRS